MAVDELSIVNDALILIGAEPITDLSANTKAARICNESYSKVRDQLLAAHPWNFATTRREITSDADLPAGYENDEWAYAHSLPSDILRVLTLDQEEPWKVEARKIFTTYTPVMIKAIKQVTDTTLFSKTFEEALAYKLAARIAYAITQSATIVEAVTKQAEEALRNARSFDAQESSLDVVEAEDFINVRY